NVLPSPAVTPPYEPANPYLNPLTYNPYLSSFDPYGGFLMGVAAVTTANAQYYATIQQARILQQQANQAAIDTRRRLFDQIRYERMNTPAPEEVRVREMEVALNRSRHQPPAAEIWSGDASTASALTWPPCRPRASRGRASSWMRRRSGRST